MMIRIKPRIALMLLTCSAVWCAIVRAAELPADTSARMHAEMLYPVVRVTVGGGGGSGTVVYSADRGDGGQTYILTNHHVIESAIKVKREWSSLLQADKKREVNDPVKVEVFRYGDGSRQDVTDTYRAEIVAHDKNHDLALLRLRTGRKLEHVARLLPQDVQVTIFRRIWAIGCSLLHPPVVTEGIVDYLDEVIDRKLYWMGSANIIYGNCLPYGTMIATLGKGEVAMKDLKLGDKVLTPYGYQRIVKVFPPQRKEIVELRTPTRTLRASADHPVLAMQENGKVASPNRGHRNTIVYRQNWQPTWRAAGDFVVGDVVVVQDSAKRLVASSKPGVCYAVLPPHCGTELISKVTKQPSEEVVDIQLEGVHEFFADGILVHNSGGAVFVEHDGHYYFIGVPSRLSVTGFQAVTHMGYFVPIPRIRKWIADEHLTFLTDANATPAACFQERKKLQKKAELQLLRDLGNEPTPAARPEG